MQQLLKERGRAVHWELRERGWRKEEMHYYTYGEDELKFLVPKHVPHPHTNEIIVPAFYGDVEDVADLVEDLIDAEEEQELEEVYRRGLDDLSECDTTWPGPGKYGP